MHHSASVVVSGKSTVGFRSVRRFLTCLIAGELLLASIAKALFIVQFQRTLEVSMLVPNALVPAVAVGIIAVEAATGIGLTIPRFSYAFAKVAVMLSSLFVGYGFWRVIKQISPPCSCFGPILNLPPAGSVALSLSTFVVAGYLLMTGTPPKFVRNETR